MDSLDKLFYWRGIANEYWNYRGELIQVSTENRVRLLNAMGVDTSSQAAIDEAAYELDIAPWQDWLAPFLLTEEQQNCFDVNLDPEALGKTFQFEIALEQGGTKKGSFKPSDAPEAGDYIWEGVRYSRRSITTEDVPLGYHNISIWIDEEEKKEHAQYIVVPEQAYNAAWVGENKKPWGIIIQLYTLRSDRNWGIGDFTDLKYLIEHAAEVGVDMIGLNPLHALCTPVGEHCSPYSPSDRRFISPLYLDPEIEPEFVALNLALPNALGELRATDFVEYQQIYDLKFGIFAKMFAYFVEHDLKQKTERAQAFKSYVALNGHALLDYCVFQAFRDAYGYDKDATEDNLAAFKQRPEAEQRIAFHQYLQWLSNEQLEACQAAAEAGGMSVGLMRDLAVGADGGGAEILTNHHLFCRDAAVGAPPDPLAEKGQNWGLPPMDPATLRSTGFEHFINLLRTNMSHCGALRIDHAMSLLRLWWCPPGKTADYGAYIYYPFREMLGLLKLESVRNKCMVIGEDMGVVPPELRQALYDSHIFTNKLFYFEKRHDGQFKAPNEYEPKSLAMLTNHDVPTLSSWWVGSDLSLRKELDLLDDGVSFEDVLKNREEEKKRLLHWLAERGAFDLAEMEACMKSDMSLKLIGQILLAASQCHSQLYVVQLEELELLEAPVNVPGTSDQYPNWRRRLSQTLEQTFSDNQINSLLQTISSQRQQQ